MFEHMYEWGDDLCGEIRMRGQAALRSFVLACGAEYARPALPTDHVAGVPASWVTAPRDAAQVAQVLQIAADHELSVAVCGSGTKLDWGDAPRSVDVLIDTVRLSGVSPEPVSVSGAPLDQSAVTIGAGASLRSVRAALASTGRRLPLDVPSPGATFGGALGTDESGPLRHSAGPVRALVSEVELVTADGTIRTVREETALLVGACGALGVVTQATVRIEPAPATGAWVVWPVRDPREVRDLTTALVDGPVPLAALEVDLPAVTPGQLAVRVEGRTGEVSRRVRALRRLRSGGVIQATPPGWWGRYPFSRYQMALRIAASPGQIHAAVYALSDAVGGAVSVRGSVGSGLLHAALPGGLRPDRVPGAFAAVNSTLRARGGGSCRLLRAPQPVRALVELADVTGERTRWTNLAPLAKAWLDPGRRFVPGRMPSLG